MAESSQSTQRLDKTLVNRGLVHSRTRAHQLINAGKVTVDGVVATKVSAKIRAGQRLALTQQDPWVSRAAYKLMGALDAFREIDPSGMRCLDAGASTGGFTQVLLSRGANHVVAADVGHGQLADQLRQDPRVSNVEGANLRYVAPGDLGERFGLIVADLSFISLRLVVDSLAQQAAPGADLVLMIKPQFEIGRQRLGRSGVVTSPELRREALEGAVVAAGQAGLNVRGVARSPLPGQDGNAEFFLWARSPSAGEDAYSDDRLETVDLDRIGLEAVEFGDPAG
ncbi:TlyA family RNA methyltransferase [Nesterenkonia muleiensis]|uniref:TlyA family RNA methyltransferase n=1 Tax=Nesterenkonia muleiensis TaxID=2282648 RepID=UPI000E73582E|nr:TlyA family RNA methyltransferase [Nesterenkonia muleiensis]